VYALTPKEAALLRFLFVHEGRVLDRATLLDHVWGISCDVTTRTVDQHVVRLRQKIEDDPAAPRFLVTVHGAGYRFSRS
jgi:DNA-binding response OmpR family regulator